ncbi:MAG: tRNA lysidine(34) synthetase TilS, partial [bacterium]|nr:tRNA lysidine(34) synthetase TilS [bacterium]
MVVPIWQSRVDRFLSRYLAPSDRVLAAVSGGADSIGLLAYLHDVYGLKGERLVVAHVNHGIREDAGQDEAISREASEMRGLLFATRKQDTPVVARARHLSIEAAARYVRYAALSEMADEHRCQWIVTGHTLDDSAETVLMRQRSGAPWYEWTAIPRRRGRILRPLLSVYREELRHWVAINGFPFHSDPSNADQRFARNQLRADLVQKQEFWTRQRISQVAQAGEAIGFGLQALTAISGSVPGLRRDHEGEIGLAIEAIFRYFSDLTFLPVEAAWAKLAGQRGGRLSSAFRRQISDLLRGRSPEAAIELPSGIRAIRRGGHLWLGRSERVEVCRPIHFGRTPVPERGGTILVGNEPCDKHRGSWTVSIRSEVAARELWIRTWRASDRMMVRGRPAKKISILLKERGLGPFAQHRALVVADAQGPLWIVGGD